MKICCPCDELKHPAKPEITAGLPSLRRQLAGFPEFRVAMLRDIPKYAALHQWRAREGNDLGIMLLEMWAYVLDVIGFYDERIANESYLRTAVNRSSLRKLVASDLLAELRHRAAPGAGGIRRTRRYCRWQPASNTPAGNGVSVGCVQRRAATGV